MRCSASRFRGSPSFAYVPDSRSMKVWILGGGRWRSIRLVPPAPFLRGCLITPHSIDQLKGNVASCGRDLLGETCSGSCSKIASSSVAEPEVCRRCSFGNDGDRKFNKEGRVQVMKSFRLS